MPATVWKGHLSFGLISIPVRLQRAARAERVPLRQLVRSREPIEEFAPPAPPVRRGKVVEMAPPPEPPQVARAHQTIATEPGDEVVKGFEYGPEQWAVLDKAELKSITARTTKVIDIREFVSLGEIDPLYLESSYYVSPDRGGEKPYAVFYQALRDSGQAALGEVAMHNREHVLVVRAGRSGVIAHTLFFEDEVHREEEPRADLALVQPREVELAVTLVRSLSAPFEPAKYKDAYRQRLQDLIDAKAQGRELAREAPAAEAPPPPGDLMEALQQSLASLKKPPAPEAGPTPKRKTAR